MTNDSLSTSDYTLTTKDFLRKQAWDYFQTHASQRLTTFNFYIVTSGVITAAMVGTFQKEFRFPLIGVGLGLLLIFFSFVFWKLDNRNRSLIKNAEKALRWFEREASPDGLVIDPMIRIFTIEENEITENQELAFKDRFFSYSKCFRFVFGAFSAVGSIGVAISIFQKIFW